MELAVCPISNPDRTFPEPFICILGETRIGMGRTGREGRLLSAKERQEQCLVISSFLMLSSGLGRQLCLKNVSEEASMQKHWAACPRRLPSWSGDSEASLSLSILTCQVWPARECACERVTESAVTFKALPATIPLSERRLALLVSDRRPVVKFAWSLHMTERSDALLLGLPLCHWE